MRRESRKITHVLQPNNKVVGISKFRSLLNVLCSGVFTTEIDVLLYCTGEENGFLRNHAELFSYPLNVQFSNVVTVDKDLSGGDERLLCEFEQRAQKHVCDVCALHSKTSQQVFVTSGKSGHKHRQGYRYYALNSDLFRGQL